MDNVIIVRIGSSVTILILIDGFLQCNGKYTKASDCNAVTILILIDGFLQFQDIKKHMFVLLSQSLF